MKGYFRKKLEDLKVVQICFFLLCSQTSSAPSFHLLVAFGSSLFCLRSYGVYSKQGNVENIEGHGKAQGTYDIFFGVENRMKKDEIEDK